MVCTLVTLPKKTFIVDPCAPLNLCIDRHAFSTDKRFQNVQQQNESCTRYKTLVPFVYSHRAAAHQFKIFLKIGCNKHTSSHTASARLIDDID
jgi:hypothetical protein